MMTIQISGPAACGKTTAATAIRDKLESDGRSVKVIHARRSWNIRGVIEREEKAGEADVLILDIDD